MGVSAIFVPATAHAARTIFFADFQTDVPDSLPASVDLFARSLVVPPPDPSGAFTTGGMFPDPFGPGNQSLVMHNPNAAAQMSVNFYSFFDEDPTSFRNGVIEYDVYMEPAEPESYWTFLDMRFGFDTDGPRTVGTVGDVTIWNAVRMQEGGLGPSQLDILYDYGEAQTFSDQDVIVPARKMRFRYEINGNTLPLPTYTLSIDNLEDAAPPVQIVWPGDNVKPWFSFFNFNTFMDEPAPGINVIAFLTDASAHGLAQKSQNVYIDNIRVINNDLAPIDSADFNFDQVVDGADFLAWQRGHGLAAGAAPNNGDANGDGAVNAVDFGIWKTQFGVSGEAATIPEPGGATIVLVLAGIANAAARSSRRSSGASAASVARR